MLTNTWHSTCPVCGVITYLFLLSAYFGRKVQSKAGSFEKEFLGWEKCIHLVYVARCWDRVAFLMWYWIVWELRSRGAVRYSWSSGFRVDWRRKRIQQNHDDLLLGFTQWWAETGHLISDRPGRVPWDARSYRAREWWTRRKASLVNNVSESGRSRLIGSGQLCSSPVPWLS